MYGKVALKCIEKWLKMYNKKWLKDVIEIIAKIKPGEHG